MDENLSNMITLNDEDGNPARFEFLDLIEYEAEEYIMSPTPSPTWIRRAWASW